MRRRLQDLLRLARLKEDEVVLYLSLLQLKRAGMPALIAKTGMNIMTAYRTIQRLKERGLVQGININKKQEVFAPLTLAALIQTLDREQRALGKLRESLKNLGPLLPYLDLETQERSDTQDELIELREGIDAFREEYLKIPDHCRDEFLHLGSMQNYWDVAGMGDESPEELAFRAKRYRRGVYSRNINTNSDAIRAVQMRDSKELRTLRITDDIPVKHDYVAFADNYICHFICDKNDPRVVIIRHPELQAFHRKQFTDLWRSGS
jgi:sugar-specific transcriptional regulator TrmB